ncbi:hypothetical protein NQ318_002430 [Aromia moschata]|uniref:Uncharacterized protein n=1 Tax=Aromia moschata TaxID=1265417 RepID=A0AAV8YGE8_9CUCU|nr:hypothetical protein NQ318_002430 [Aromia moschata]
MSGNQWSDKKGETENKTTEEPKGENSTDASVTSETSSSEPKSRKKRSILDFQERDNSGVDGDAAEEFK